MAKLTDESVLYFGEKHYGKKLANVPADYLIYIYENYKTIPQNLRDYIEENLDDLKEEQKQEKQQRSNQYSTRNNRNYNDDY